MAIVNSHYGYCAAGSAVPKFTYTGTYNVRNDGVVELLTSGTIVFLEPKVIDVFMVGGGGGGGNITGSAGSSGLGGGGGGYTRTVRRVSVPANTNIPVTVGAGGAPNSDGGASAFNTIYTVNGGKTAANYSSSNVTKIKGGPGGSGGGGGVISNSDYGAGGYNGNDGEAGYGLSNINGGNGQHFTTREFIETAGKLYAGGGGGGRYIAGATFVISPGGSGGGGSGACGHGNDAQPAAAGVANTGGGGGGAAASYNGIIGNAGSGGSGIVCFRDAVELPELAGTWVLNERLYAPGNNISQYTDFTATYGSSAISCTRAQITDTKVIITSDQGRAITIYTFSNNSWGSGSRYGTWTFPAGATASDTFRAWLASNATKQS